MNARLEWTLLAVLAATAGGGYVFLSDRATPGGPAASSAENAFGLEDAEGQELQAPPAPALSARSLSMGLPTQGQWRGNPILRDLDGDGHLDLVASIRRIDQSTPGEGIFVWRGDGLGEWRPWLDGLRRDMSYGGSAVADVDGDGRLDIAFSGHDQRPHVFLQGEDSVWKPLSAGIDLDGVCADVALGDFDQDGNVDLATVGFYPKNGGLVAFLGDGFGAFHRWEDLIEPVHYGARVTAADLDGDGRPEVLAATSTGPRVWSFDGEAWVDRSQGFEAPEIGGSDLALLHQDLDGDGRPELLSVGMNYPGHPSLRLFRLEDETWTSWGDLPADEAFFDAEFAQLDGRGAPELVAAGRFGISVFTMTAPGVFERTGRIAGTDGVINVTAGDVTGDGRDEVVFVGYGGVHVYDLAEGGGE